MINSHAVKPTLCEIDDNYIPHGVSGDDERNNIRRESPKGGYAIWWHKSVSHRVPEIPCKNRRICGITFKMDDGRTILFICCYMLNDNRTIVNNYIWIYRT